MTSFWLGKSLPDKISDLSCGYLGGPGVAKRENTCADFYHYPQMGCEGKQSKLKRNVFDVKLNLLANNLIMMTLEISGVTLIVVQVKGTGDSMELDGSICMGVYVCMLRDETILFISYE